jgi:hypothetical protein
MTGLRISILGTVACLAVSSLGVTSCSSGPCSLRHVVTESNSGMKVDQIELDDGFVYVPLPAESHYAHEYTTGTEVRVCEVASQVDGTTHYSIIATDVQGSPTEMRRLEYQGTDN